MKLEFVLIDGRLRAVVPSSNPYRIIWLSRPGTGNEPSVCWLY